jgi:GTPase SAR1 family protein
MAALRIAAIGASGAGKTELLAALANQLQRPFVATEAASIRELCEARYDLVLECLDVRAAVGSRAKDGEGRGGYTGAFIRVYTKMDETDGALLPDEPCDSMDEEDAKTETWQQELRYETAFSLTVPVTGGANASFAVSARTQWRLDDLAAYVQELPLAR